MLYYGFIFMTVFIYGFIKSYVICVLYTLIYKVITFYTTNANINIL